MLIVLPVSIIAIALIFAFSGCCVSIPLRLASRAASAAASDSVTEVQETGQNDDSAIEETAAKSSEESATETSASATESTSAPEDTTAEIT